MTTVVRDAQYLLSEIQEWLTSQDDPESWRVELGVWDLEDDGSFYAVAKANRPNGTELLLGEESYASMTLLEALQILYEDLLEYIDDE